MATTLHRADGRLVFLKGVRGVSPRMRWLRNEATAGVLAPGVSPEVLFHEDVGDWLVVGFEHIVGRAAVLTPDSADLTPVASTVDRIAALPGTGLRPLRDRWAGGQWWRKLAEEAPEHVWVNDVNLLADWTGRAPELVHGDHLLHTDLHADQFVIGARGEVHVIDWGWPAAGAKWVDAAFLVIRLMVSGHAAADAESWARKLTAWSDVSEEALTAFAVYVAGLWTHRAVTDPQPGAARRAKVAREYAAWRLAAHAAV
ncbi:hypothetical protein [Amycolatopsis nigrescens]|uniref:hypothetical protein n=1 Tax=Amycolatopsis nigrescens TaxID=381445 RepID=UPI001FE20ECA|nr:hypothetical protein [Amycolatopsis nigrescens]